MDADDDVRRPPPLHIVLDAGCDLLATGVWLAGLAEDLYRTLPFLPPKERARQARTWRTVAEDLIAHGKNSALIPVWTNGSRGPAPEMFQQYLSAQLWRAEIYEDETLAERLREALPGEVTAEHRDAVDCYRRPHPLEVRIPAQWWTCNNCGRSFDEGEEEAVSVTDRDGYSDLPYPIEYCFGCVTALGELARQTRGDQG